MQTSSTEAVEPATQWSSKLLIRHMHGCWAKVAVEYCCWSMRHSCSSSESRNKPATGLRIQGVIVRYRGLGFLVLGAAIQDHVLFTAAGFAWAFFLLQLQQTSYSYARGSW